MRTGTGSGSEEGGTGHVAREIGKQGGEPRT